MQRIETYRKGKNIYVKIPLDETRNQVKTTTKYIGSINSQSFLESTYTKS